MVREKHVFSTDEIPHLWANQSKADARNQHGNLFFEGNVIYSYRHSWPVGVIVTNEKGQKAVMVNSDTYSVTTAGHTNLVRYASRHIEPRFTIPLCDYRPDENENDADKCFKGHYQKLIGTTLAKAAKARQNKPSLVAEADRLKTEANTFAKFFGVTARIRDDKGMTALRREAEEREKQNKVERKARDAAYRLAQVEAEAQKAKNLEAWLAGDNVDSYQLPSGWNEPTRLRIKGDSVETSRGASVPLSHALRVFRFVKVVKAREELWKRNGHTLHIGNYSVDEITADGDIRAGCHNIAWAEVERIGNQLEAMQVKPDEGGE